MFRSDFYGNVWSSGSPNTFHAYNGCDLYSSFRFEPSQISAHPYGVSSLKGPKVFRPIVLYKEDVPEFPSDLEINTQGTKLPETNSNRLHSDINGTTGNLHGFQFSESKFCQHLSDANDALPVSSEPSWMGYNSLKSHTQSTITNDNEFLPPNTSSDNITADFRDKTFDTRFSENQIFVGTNGTENPSVLRCASVLHHYGNCENIATSEVSCLNKEYLAIKRQGIIPSNMSNSTMHMQTLIKHNWTDSSYQSVPQNCNTISGTPFPHWTFSDGNHPVSPGKDIQQNTLSDSLLVDSSKDSIWKSSVASPSLFNFFQPKIYSSQHLYPKDACLNRRNISAFRAVGSRLFSTNDYYNACVFSGNEGLGIERADASFKNGQISDKEMDGSKITYGKKANTSAERPFKCECGRMFARSEELTRHKRIHSGYKPHRCNICTKHFGRKDHLNKHLKTHLRTSEKKTHLCTVAGCRLSYTRSDALTRHQWTSHGIPPSASKWRPRKERQL